MDYAGLIVVVIVAIYVAMAIRIANDNERFAVFTLGRFVGLKGPGLVMTIPGSGSNFHRVALGAEGEIQSNELVLIGNRTIPFTSDATVRSRQKVRVCGFDSAHVKVELLQQFLVCQKCGHKNVV